MNNVSNLRRGKTALVNELNFIINMKMLKINGFFDICPLVSIGQNFY